MGYSTPDTYNQPEAFDGLTLVATLDLLDEPYEYEMLGVWHHPDRGLLFAHDAGCSCTAPFETYASLEALEPIDVRGLKTKVARVTASIHLNPARSEVDAFLRAARKAVA